MHAATTPNTEKFGSINQIQEREIHAFTLHTKPGRCGEATVCSHEKKRQAKSHRYSQTTAASERTTMGESQEERKSFSDILGKWSERTDDDRPPPSFPVGKNRVGSRGLKTRGNPQEDLVSPKPNDSTQLGNQSSEGEEGKLSPRPPTRSLSSPTSKNSPAKPYGTLEEHDRIPVAYSRRLGSTNSSTMDEKIKSSKVMRSEGDLPIYRGKKNNENGDDDNDNDAPVRSPIRRTSIKERAQMFNKHSPKKPTESAGSSDQSADKRPSIVRKGSLRGGLQDRISKFSCGEAVPDVFSSPKPRSTKSKSMMTPSPAKTPTSGGSKPKTSVSVAGSALGAPDLVTPPLPAKRPVQVTPKQSVSLTLAGERGSQGTSESSDQDDSPPKSLRKNSLMDRISKFSNGGKVPAGLANDGLLSPRVTQRQTKKEIPDPSGVGHLVSPQFGERKTQPPSSIEDAKSLLESLPSEEPTKKTTSTPFSPTIDEEDNDDEARDTFSPTVPAGLPPGNKFISHTNSSFKDRILMFSKAAAPPPDLMVNTKSGFLNPKYMKKMEPKEDSTEDQETVPVPPAPPLAEKSADDGPEQPKMSLDQAQKISVKNRIAAFSNFHDRRTRMKANRKSDDPKQKQMRKAPSKRNVFNVIAEKVEDLSKFKPPSFPKDRHDTKLILLALSKNFVFDDLEQGDRERFVDAFQHVKFAMGTDIINQGDTGDYFYVIAEGEVSFIVNGNEVGKAGAGKSFGELALLYTCPRAATVRALSQPTSLFRVDQTTFRFMMQSQTKRSGAAKEKLLKGISFLAHLGSQELQRLSAVMVPCLFGIGDYIVRKGEQGDTFYVLQNGQVRVTDISVGGVRYEDVTLGPGDYFGEGALISSQPRAANIVALTEGSAFAIDRATFEKVLGQFKEVIFRAQDTQRLAGIKIFKDAELSESDISSLVTYISDKKYGSNELIFDDVQDTAASMYIVREGNVKITKKDVDENVGPGAFFGQEQLLADSGGILDGSCLIRSDYVATAGPDGAILGLLTLADCRSVFDTTTLGDGIYGSSLSHLTDKRASIRLSISARSVGLENLKRESILGEGQFGEVWLVKTEVFEDEEHEFALKIQAKDDPVRRDGAIDAIKREMNVIRQLNHPFIIDLVETYESDQSIFMLMELVRGGELWSVIHQEDDDGNWTSGLSESHAKFYGLVLADTLAYMHRQKFVFRDLKPENVLIDSDGYPILVDFGFAKLVTDKTFTFCGTPNYLAPEIVMNRGHGVGVDHWALGVVIYEMVSGENPFYYEEMDQIALFKAIVQEEFYPFEEKVSPEVQGLVASLLEKDPAQRIGNLSGKEKDILKHPWFASLDFHQIRMKEAKAPWVPTEK